MVLDLAVVVVAIILLILGAKGSYKKLWNQLLPNTPLVSSPTVASGGGGAGGVIPGQENATSFATIATGTNPPAATAAPKYTTSAR
jgi:hypothetical protein